MTRASLLARSTRFEARTAARVDANPAAPTMAAITICTLPPTTALGQRRGSALDARRRAAAGERPAGLRRGFGIDQYHGVGMKLPGLLDDGLPTAVRTQHRDAEPVRVQGEHAERAAADAPRRPRMAMPRTPLMRSHRSRTSQRIQGSGRGHAVEAVQQAAVARQQGAAVLEAAARLNMLSVKSPMTENIPTSTARPRRRPAAGRNAPLPTKRRERPASGRRGHPPRFAGAHAGRQFVPPETASCEIRTDIGGHHQQHQPQHDDRAVGKPAMGVLQPGEGR